MKVSEIEVPTMVEPTEFKYDYPTTPKENIMRFYNHEKPIWMANPIRSSQMVLCPANQDMPNRMDGEAEDWFGTKYVFSPTYGTPTPVSGMLKDILKWKDEVKFPNLDDYDWTIGVEDFKRDPDLALMTQYGNGIWERLHILMGIENALISMIEEPETCKEFFMAVSDLKIDTFNRMYEQYPFDYVVYNDDWGTAKDAFFSPKLWEQVLFEPTKKLFDAFKAKGVKICLHSCGHIEKFVPYMVELGADVLQIQPINDIAWILKNYGDKLSVEYTTDPYFMNDPDVKDEDVIEYAHKIVDKYGAHVNNGSGVLISNVQCTIPERANLFEKEILDYSIEKYKNL